MENRADILAASLARAVFVWLLCISFTFIASAQDEQSADNPGQTLDPFAVYAEVARLTDGREVWPGFSISEMPIAIYDGRNTYLFYHPNPPAGFAQNPDREAIYEYPGRYEAVVGNTSVEINGAVTATVLLDSLKDATTEEAAAVLLHEAFHVYQMSKHLDWAANEADSFTYPVENVEALALRRLESLALQNALESFSKAESASWAKLFLETRRQRFALIPESSAAYERGIELMEGTAHYLQYKMLEAPSKDILPPQEFAAEAVRARAYASGRAQCVLLDRLLPRWKVMLEQGSVKCLDELLGFAVDVRSEVLTKQFAKEEITFVREKAGSDVSELTARRLAAKADFESLEGNAVIIDAAASALMPRGFDPMNIVVLGNGSILHKRFISLGGEAGKLDIWNHQALTIGSADSPMFGGLMQVVIRGLGDLQISEKDGVVTISGEGIAAELKGRLLQTADNTFIWLGENVASEESGNGVSIAVAGESNE